ncbi:MAG: DUF4838 domain-containing protein [Victivallales bacterium]
MEKSPSETEFSRYLYIPDMNPFSVRKLRLAHSFRKSFTRVDLRSSLNCCQFFTGKSEVVACFLVAAVLSVSSVVRADITLVDNGKPVSAIVVEKAPSKTSADAKPDPKTETAFERYESVVLIPAKHIQDALRKMTGAEVSIIEEGVALPDGVKARVLVGRTEAAREAGVKLLAGCDLKPRPDAFAEEGYVLRTVGNDIYIVGNQDVFYRGTAYGCYAFLERLGCRWYFPGDWGEVIPKSATVAVPELNVESHPDFPVRHVWMDGFMSMTPAQHKEFKQWSVKAGLNPGHKYYMLYRFYPNATDGSLVSLLPPKEYGTNHPDFYATRADGTLPTNGSTMLCLSNPDVLTESIKNLKEGFEGKPKVSMITMTGAGFSPPDGSPYCYCKACKGGDGNFFYPRYIHKPMSSELYFRFMAELAKAFPEKYISAMAYAGREMPPQGLRSVPPNLVITYAPISCDVLHPDNHPKSWRCQEKWSILSQYRRLTPHVLVYDYNPGLLQGYCVPERMTENLAVNIPMYKKLDIKGMSTEGKNAGMETWLSYYVMGKLLWDSKTDVNQLKTEFYTNFFGDAGSSVRAWWDTIAETLVQADIQAHEDWLLTHIYTVDFTAKLHEHVKAAQQAAKEEPYRSRVAAFALIADHLESYASMYEAEKNMDYTAALKAAERTEQDKAKLSQASPYLVSTNGVYNTLAFSSQGRIRGYRQLLDMTQGTNGTLVAALPLESPFKRDEFNRGVPMEWYAPGLADADWEKRNTFYLWDQQEKPLTEAGDDWDGYGWYRMKVEVPVKWKNKPMRLWLGGVINEGWVWVNGAYAGHRPHALWWTSPHELDLDISQLVKPGQTNLIVVRVYNNAESGGLYRRGFLYSPLK